MTTGRNIMVMLESEARRRPEIAAMLEIIELLTDEDIDTAVVPLPWYRKALKQARDIKLGAAATARITAIMDDPATNPVETFVTPEIMGTQIIYTGEDAWVKKREGDEIRIPYNTLLFIADSGELYYNSTHFKQASSALNRHTVVGRSSLNAYKKAYHDLLLKNHPDAPVIASEAANAPNGASAVLGYLGVRLG